MGIFGRMKRAMKSKANAAIDKAIDPEKEIDMAILELEEQKKSALAELVSYKTTAKVIDKDIESQQQKAEIWEKRAMLAVKQGDDELAKQCLKEQKMAAIEVRKMTADRDEAATYAIQLNQSRKKVETQLQILKLKKGTLANQLAAARSGTGNAFGHSDDVFEKMERAEQAIDDEVIEAELEAALEGEHLADDIDAKLLAKTGTLSGGGLEADDELKRLKAEVAADRERRRLAAAPSDKAAPSPASESADSGADSGDDSGDEKSPEKR